MKASWRRSNDAAESRKQHEKQGRKVRASLGESIYLTRRNSLSREIISSRWEGNDPLTR